ncbi:MAG: TraX family protein [Clostridium sp.]|uniref:TraX family protein n=1 Tax=Clostridium sp. TaxID=1506 RepID=UPI003020A2AE
MKYLSSFSLKIMAIITMTLDHILYFIGAKGGVEIPIWFGYLGRLAAPIFFFLIIEGFFHTKSRKKYLLRLAMFSGLMIPIDIMLGISNNIFLSLTVAVLIMLMLENIKNKKKTALSVVALIIFTLAAFVTEASLYGVGMTYIFYFFRERKVLMASTYTLFSLFPVITSIGSSDIYDKLFLFDYQWMMIFALPLILMYNGKLGLKNTFTKWIFYVYYPLHLTVLALLSTVV